MSTTPPAAHPAPSRPASSLWASWRLRLSALSFAHFFRGDQLFLLIAVVIGLYSGLIVVLFRITIDYVRLRLLGTALTPPAWRVLVMPAVMGLVVAYLVVRFFPRSRGSGVNQTKAAMYIYDGYIPFNTVGGKFLICSLGIGGGHSLGPEDPSLQMGAGIASALGRRLRLAREKLRLIAPVGAAAGLAAAFNSPISAVLFVIEEVIGRWSAGVLGAVVLSSVSSVVVARSFLGDEALFRVPQYHLAHPAELLAYAVLGVVGGLASLAFIKMLTWLRPRLRALPRWTEYVQPAAAGLLIGVIGLWLPQVMGAGYGFIDQAMNDQYTWRMLAILALFKIVATTISFTSGTPGGMFAPTLFIGAMIGGAVGGIEHTIFPTLSGSVGAFALVGMGTLFAGFLRAPFTSVFMVLEVSGNYSIIVPVMISNTIAYLISRRFEPTPIFDALSRQDGLDLPSMEEEREESLLRVEDAMRSYTGPQLSPEMSLSQALAYLTDLKEEFLLLGSPDGSWRGTTRAELAKKISEGGGNLSLDSFLGTRHLPWVHPDQPLYIALRQIYDSSFLPVLHRADFRRLEGIVSVHDALDAYRRLGGAENRFEPT